MADAPLDASLALLADVNPDVIVQPSAAAASSAPSGDASASAASPAAAAAPATVNAEKAGWMSKNSYTSTDTFTRYYFVLQNSQLNYYEQPESASVRGSIQLEGCSCDITPESKYGQTACFELNSPLQSRVFALACESTEDMQQWINVIRKAMLKIRRQKAKDATQKKRQAVEGAAQESQQAQQAREQQQQQSQALSSAPLSSSSSSSSSSQDSFSYAPPASAAASSNPAASASAVGGSTSLLSAHDSGSSSTMGQNPYKSPSGAEAMTPEEKYTVYRQWLDESKQAKAGGGGNAGAGPGRGSMSGASGGELHTTLLEEENKQKSFFETYCGCCPVWCFR